MDKFALDLLDYIRQGRYNSPMKKTVQLFKALADETRLRIISLLLTDGELCVCDIIAALKLPQSTISRHLSYLKRAGWVDDRKCGLWVYYSVKTQDIYLLLDLKDVVQRHISILPTTAADRKQLEHFGRDHHCT